MREQMADEVTMGKGRVATRMVRQDGQWWCEINESLWLLAVHDGEVVMRMGSGENIYRVARWEWYRKQVPPQYLANADSWYQAAVQAVEREGRK